MLVRRSLCCLTIAALGLSILGIPSRRVSAQESAPSALDKIDPKKVPLAVRAKDLPKEVIAVLGERDGRVDTVAIRGDGKMLAVGGAEGGIRIWDLATLKLLTTLKFNQVTALAFSPSGKTLAAADAQGTVRFWSSGGAAFTAGTSVAAHKDGPVWSIAFSPDGKWFASGGSDKMVKLREVGKANMQPTATLAGHTQKVRSVAFSSDGKWLASGGDDQTLRRWNLEGDKPKEQEALNLKTKVNSLSIAPDGKTMAVATGEGKVRLYGVDGESFKEMESIAESKRGVASVQFAPDGKSILSLVPFDVNEDRALIWDLEGNIRYESKFKQHLGAIVYAPDGRHIVAVPEVSVYLIRLPK